MNFSKEMEQSLDQMNSKLNYIKERATSNIPMLKPSLKLNRGKPSAAAPVKQLTGVKFSDIKLD